MDILYIRIKKEYAYAIMENLIKADAFETVKGNDIEIMVAQIIALNNKP